MTNDEKEKLHKLFLEKFKKISEIFQNKNTNVREEMEKLGYEWVDDGTDEIERQEEELAQPQNERERLLLNYFEGQINLSDDILNLFLAEKNSEDPNEPLWRGYFKRGNGQLKKLLLYGLQGNSKNHSLLVDLVYFNEFHPDIVELRNAFILACRSENEPDIFEKLARQFWICTEAFGYEALPELFNQFENDAAKIKIVARLIDESNKPLEPIKF